MLNRVESLVKEKVEEIPYMQQRNYKETLYIIGEDNNKIKYAALNKEIKEEVNDSTIKEKSES